MAFRSHYPAFSRSMKPAELKLRLIAGAFTVHRLDPEMAIPDGVLDSSPWFMAQTDDELSIVCRSSIAIEHATSEVGWACFMVVGPLDFSLTGILSRLSAVLASERISIFAVSTFDTDYILVKETDLPRAQKVLESAGYAF